jgi:hypothetical protein
MDFSVCQSAEQIILSPRLGKLITLQSRNYFGLFPKIKNYQSAILIQDNSTKFFEVKTDNSTEKIPVTDSTIIALAFVIDRFEEIITNPNVYGMNKDLIAGLIKISTTYNNKSKKAEIVLKDNSKAKGYIIFVDSTYIVLTKSQDYDHRDNKFRILHYSDIYSILGKSQINIYNFRDLFEFYIKEINELAKFKNANDYNVAPPEVMQFIKDNPFKTVQNDEIPNADLDSPLLRNYLISFETSYQQFNVNNLKVSTLFNNEVNNNNYVLSFRNYFSFNTNFEYRLLNSLRFQIGMSLENIAYAYGNDSINGNLESGALNLNLLYTLWHNKTYHYQQKQVFLNIFTGIQLKYYGYSIPTKSIVYMKYDNDIINTEEITKGVKQSYKMGLNFSYKYNKSDYLLLSVFANYHSNYGIINFSEYLTTRYINYILSYGIAIGFAHEII